MGAIYKILPPLYDIVEVPMVALNMLNIKPVCENVSIIMVASW